MEHNSTTILLPFHVTKAINTRRTTQQRKGKERLEINHYAIDTTQVEYNGRLWLSSYDCSEEV